MLTQTLLPVHYTADYPDTAMTSFSGLPLYMNLAMASGLSQNIAETLQTKTQGWTDVQIVLSLILLNLSGGDCVDDIDRLEADEGLRLLLLKIETYGMRRRERREHEKRWRKEKRRAFPSPSVIRRYLAQYHSESEEARRVPGKAFIPSNTVLLNHLVTLNTSLLDFIQQQHPIKTATLDQDATLCPTNKLSALYCYKKFKAYQPFNTYWHEHDVLLHSEFRDGNVNAGFDQLRVLQSALACLPKGVEKVRMRSDSAGYQVDVLQYCAEGTNSRFGVIDFAIAVKVSQAFKKAVADVDASDWKPFQKRQADGSFIQTNQEWAEICFVPDFVAQSKTGPTYRYVAIRERLADQLELDVLDDVEAPKQATLPFPTMTLSNVAYKVTGIVTNMPLSGNELIQWHRERCGHSEKVHSVQKSDLSGGQFPSDKFGANAAWWHIMVLSHNLQSAMKQFVLPKEVKSKRLKGCRFHIIGVAGRFVRHARGLCIKLSGGQQTEQWFIAMQQKIAALVSVPSPPLAVD